MFEGIVVPWFLPSDSRARTLAQQNSVVEPLSVNIKSASPFYEQNGL